MRGANFEGRAGKLKSEDGIGRERKVFLRSGPIWGEKLLLVKWRQLGRGGAERREEKRTERQKIEQKKRENRRKSEKK